MPGEPRREGISGERSLFTRYEEEMNPVSNPLLPPKCPICGNLVPTASLSEHLLADARMLGIIKTTHPKWSRQECEDHLRNLHATSRYGKRTNRFGSQA